MRWNTRCEDRGTGLNWPKDGTGRGERQICYWELVLQIKMLWKDPVAALQKQAVGEMSVMQNDHERNLHETRQCTGKEPLVPVLHGQKVLESARRFVVDFTV